MRGKGRDGEKSENGQGSSRLAMVVFFGGEEKEGENEGGTGAGARGNTFGHTTASRFKRETITITTAKAEIDGRQSIGWQETADHRRPYVITN